MIRLIGKKQTARNQTIAHAFATVVSLQKLLNVLNNFMMDFAHLFIVVTVRDASSTVLASFSSLVLVLVLGDDTAF